MAESGDLANAVAESSTAFAHYVLRTAAHSVRTLHLYEQVIGCVARRQIAPSAIRESLAALLQDQAAESAATAASVTTRFFVGLASCAFLPAEEADPPPDVEADADAVEWFERLSEHAVKRDVRAVEIYLSQLARLSAGETTPAEFRRGISVQHSRELAELSRVARLWFELLGDLDDLRARSAEEHLLGAIRNANPIGFDSDVIELAAPAGMTASKVVSLQNMRDEQAVVHCVLSDVRRADGVGPAFVPDIAITPAMLVIERNHEARIRLSVRLDETVYERDTPYIGALHMSRNGEPRIEVPLRITSQSKDGADER